MHEGALTPETGTQVPAGGEPLRRATGRRGLLARLWRSERGTALVEFALVALPLFLVLFGIIDFARALNYYNDVTQLAGQGARAAAVNTNPDTSAPVGTSIQTQLVNAADSPELKVAGTDSSGNPRGIQVCINQPLPTKAGDPVSVQASYRFHFLPLIGAALTLSSTQTERYESGLAPAFAYGCVHP
jgi:hypothetical protein